MLYNKKGAIWTKEAFNAVFLDINVQKCDLLPCFSISFLYTKDMSKDRQTLY